MNTRMTVHIAALNGRTLHIFTDCRHIAGKEIASYTLRGTTGDGTITHGMTWCAACDRRAIAGLDSPNASIRIAAQDCVAAI